MTIDFAQILKLINDKKSEKNTANVYIPSEMEVIEEKKDVDDNHK